MHKKIIKHTLVILFFLLLLFTLTSCTGFTKNQEEGTLAQQEQTDQAKIFAAVFQNSNLKASFAEAASAKIWGDTVLYSSRFQTQDSSVIRFYERPLYEAAEPAVFWESKIGMGEMIARNIFSAPAGEKYILVSNGYLENCRWQLIRLDKENSQSAVLDISDILNTPAAQGYAYLGITDNDGCLYLLNEESLDLHIMSSSGLLLGTVSAQKDTLLDIIRGKDGEIYLIQQRYQNETMQIVINKVDRDHLCLRETAAYTIAPERMSALPQVAGYFRDELLLWDGEGVFLLNPKTGAESRLFQWTDEYIDIGYEELLQVFPLENGKIGAFLYDGYSGQTEIATMELVETKALPQKEILIFGTARSGQNENDIRRFNRKNRKYRIKVECYASEQSSYYADQNLYEDILAGEAPDILDVMFLDLDNLAEKGVLQDLTPYFQESTAVKKEDLLPSVWADCQTDGKVACMVDRFVLDTIAIKKETAEGQEGCTIEELMQMSARYPQSYLLDSSNFYMLFDFCIFYDLDTFVNWETGKCSFDSQRFKERLEFIKGLRVMEGETARTISEEDKKEMFRNGEILLYRIQADTINRLVKEKATLGEDITWIGYPNSNGTLKTLYTPISLLAMNAASEHKEGVWAFFEFLLSEEEQKRKCANFPYPTEIPVRKDVIETFLLESWYTPEKRSRGLTDSTGMPTVTEEEITECRRQIEAAVRRPLGIQEREVFVREIIQEEAEAYFCNDKEIAEVAAIVQNRVELFLNE